MPEPYKFSTGLAAIWKEIVTLPVLNDPRSDAKADTKLGYDFKTTVRIRVLELGRADFTTGYRGQTELSADDKALLYAFVFAKGHLFECRKVFELDSGLATTFRTRRPTFVDVGCGPATAALAAAECFPGSTFDYIGIDRADAMLRIGDRLMRAAVDRQLIGPNSTTTWRLGWDDVRVDATADVIVMCSYLCSSDSVDVRAVSGLVEQLRDSRSTGTLWLLYANSTDSRAGEKYEELRSRLGMRQALSQLTVSGKTFVADVAKWTKQ